jgi:hypothetical protein
MSVLGFSLTLLTVKLQEFCLPRPNLIWLISIRIRINHIHIQIRRYHYLLPASGRNIYIYSFTAKLEWNVFGHQCAQLISVSV